MMTIEIRRVAWRLYTWRFEYLGWTQVGCGTKNSARKAALEFLSRHGGR